MALGAPSVAVDGVGQGRPPAVLGDVHADNAGGVGRDMDKWVTPRRHGVGPQAGGRPGVAGDTPLPGATETARGVVVGAALVASGRVRPRTAGPARPVRDTAGAYAPARDVTGRVSARPRRTDGLLGAAARRGGAEDAV